MRTSRFETKMCAAAAPPSRAIHPLPADSEQIVMNTNMKTTYIKHKNLELPFL